MAVDIITDIVAIHFFLLVFHWWYSVLELLYLEFLIIYVIFVLVLFFILRLGHQYHLLFLCVLFDIVFMQSHQLKQLYSLFHQLLSQSKYHSIAIPHVHSFPSSIFEILNSGIQLLDVFIFTDQCLLQV